MRLPWDESTETLSDARARLRARLGDGLTCPCCGQFAKRYRRKVNAGMVKSLLRIYMSGNQSKFEWVYIPALLLRSHEEGKLAYWGLLEEASVEREDGGRAGWWRVTKKGEDFLYGRLRIAKYAIVYNAVCTELDASKTVTVSDCMKTGFDLAELMKR
jgi:hypothetical protein